VLGVEQPTKLKVARAAPRTEEDIWLRRNTRLGAVVLLATQSYGGELGEDR
jgi:hypothetical protein